jgi:hypothetical protein
MAIDMDAILGEVKAEISKATPAAPAPKPARAPRAAAAPPAVEEPAEEEDVSAEDFHGDAGGEVPAPKGKKYHNFSKAFVRKYGERPEEKKEEEAT